MNLVSYLSKERKLTQEEGCVPVVTNDQWVEGELAMTAWRILNLKFLIGSSHRGPSLVPHWKP